MTQNFILEALQDAHRTTEKFLQQPAHLKQMEEAIEIMVASLKNDGRILSCGNGGSMCDSLHFAEELTGRYRKNRPPLAAMPMGDAGHLTCVANDYGYDHVFARYVEAWGRKGDTLLTISTSGNSANCIKATEMAKSKEMKVVGLLGKDGGSLKSLVDVPIVVDHKITDRIQEVHIKIIHIFIEGIERKLFPQHYI